QKYNSQSAPRLVLFSPIAHEDLRSPHLPDGTDNNKRIALYSAARAEGARAGNVVFVDLFRPSGELYRKADRPLTINGIHLTPRGNRAVAEVIDRALFGGEPGGKLAEEVLTKLRQAVREKNLHWFNRYRTVDGYSIYGGRADEPRKGQSDGA